MSYIQDKLNMRRQTDTGFKIWNFPQKSTIKAKFETESRPFWNHFDSSPGLFSSYFHENAKNMQKANKITHFQINMSDGH